jgi:hypothetical protein
MGQNGEIRKRSSVVSRLEGPSKSVKNPKVGAKTIRWNEESLTMRVVDDVSGSRGVYNGVWETKGRALDR